MTAGQLVATVVVVAAAGVVMLLGPALVAAGIVVGLLWLCQAWAKPGDGAAVAVQTECTCERPCPNARGWCRRCSCRVRPPAD